MINEPLFQQNIFQIIYRNFQHYFFEGVSFYGEKQSLLFWILGVLAFLYLNYFFVTYKQKQTYPNLFPSEKFVFDKNEKSHLLALCLLVFVLFAYAFNIYSLVQNLFVNYDLMNIGTTLAFKRGLAADVNYLRFLPLGFIDLNILYAISHNLLVLNAYTILKQVLIAYLIYRAFDFIPVAKRLVGIALICISPAFFWLNNVVFPEQNLIIFVLLSFIMLKGFSKTNNYNYLWGFIVCMNLAIYIKETTMLLYFGILVCSFLYNLAKDNFGIYDLIHPFKTIRKFPLEYVVFVSIVTFFTFFYLVTEQERNIYVIAHKRSLLEVFNIYKYEVFINILALLFFVKKIIKNDFKTNPIIIEGTLIGGTLISFIIVFYYSLVCYPAHKTYYLLIPTLFSLIYLSKEIINIKFLSVLYVFLFSYSLFINYIFLLKEEGKYNIELVELISEKIEKDEEISLYFVFKERIELWYIEAFNSALKYYYPNAKITIYTKYEPKADLAKEKFLDVLKEIKNNAKMNDVLLNQNQISIDELSLFNEDTVKMLINLGVYHSYKQKERPDIGDYVIYLYDLPQEEIGKKVLENNKFKVYYVDDKHI